VKREAVIAAVIGGTVGAVIALVLQIPIVGLLSFLIGGAVSVFCYKWIFKERITLGGGGLLGVEAGIVMSVLVAIATIFVTGLHSIEFTSAVTFFPIIICVLSLLGGCGAAFFLRPFNPTDTNQ
jgi:hypothetical protein